MNIHLPATVFWCSPGVQGFDTLPYGTIKGYINGNMMEYVYEQ